jgi:tripartite-type tricarboxylate transporter receptor subunit TctC
MKLHRRYFLHLTLDAAVLSLISRIAQAQTYPARPIHFVVPIPAGPNDALARLSGQKLSGDLKQPVVVDTRPRDWNHRN